MAYGSARYNAYNKKKKDNKDISLVTSSTAGKKNNGGLLGGLGYVGGSFAAGLAGVGEGIVDLFAAAGSAIAGDTEYAKYVFKDNQAGEWHQSLTEDYNPGKVMNFLGDVGHGLGQSSVFLLNAIPGLGQLGTVAFFTGVIGQGISNASDKTGDVGFKEVAHGVGTGATEGVLETFLGGTAKAAKSIGKGLIGSTAKSAMRKGLAREIFTGAGEEFLEEFVGEYTDVFWQRTTGVDKNASTSLKDAIRSGFVGAVSGGLSVGSASVVKYGANQQRGKRIIESGNAQTLVNTATSVADKLAGSGTDFDKAAEWVTALRGDVDAYNKLSPEQKVGAKGQVILGEMQAALGFAELQASFAGVQKKIENSDESTRAAFAEYINQTVHPSKRNKEYTAEDIAKNTDNVAWQIAILDYVNGIADIDAAIAFEESVQSKVAGEQAKAGSVINGPETVIGDGETVVDNSEPVGETKYSIKKDSSGNTYVDVDKSIVNKNNTPDQIVKVLSNVVETKFTDFVRADGQKIGINKKTAREWVKSRDASSLLRLDKSKFIDKANAFGNADELLQAAKNYIGEATKHTRKDNFVEFARGVVDFKVGHNGYSADIIVGTTKGGVAVLYDIVNIQNKKIVASESDTTQDRRHETPATDDSIPQNQPVVNTESEKNVDKRDLADKPAKNAQEGAERSGKAVEGESAKQSAESKNDGETAKKTTTETTDSTPKVSEAKESLTDEQRKARARERAEKLIEWEKETAPTTKELNEARAYVKNFDNLEKNRRLAIIRTIRSAEGKVSKDILKGVANIMAVNPKSDLEFRFADGIGNKGLTTKIGNKTVIVIDSGTDFKNTVKGTIAHELVHYLENRAEYKEFASYVRKHAKPEAVKKHRTRYTEFYRNLFTAELTNEQENISDDIKAKVEERLASKETQELIKSEITASLVGDALQSERFLKRYADHDKKFIARVSSWLRDCAAKLKMTDEAKAAAAIADEYSVKVGLLLQLPTVRESDGGTKYAFDGTPEQIADWEKPITLQDVEILRSIGRKSINAFTSEDIKKAQKWAYKFYKELGVKSPFFRLWLGDWRQYERSNLVNILKMEHRGGKNPRGQYKNNDTGWVINSSSVGYDETISHSGKDKKSIIAMQNIDKIIENAILLDTEVSEYGRGKKSIYTAFMHKFYSLINIDDKTYIAKMSVDESHAPGQNDTNKKFYHVRAIEIETASSVGIGESHTPIIEDTVSTVSIADLFEIVKRNDKEFNPKSVSEYVLNKDGTPKVFYHGTDFDFNVFSYGKIGNSSGEGILGEGFYFADKNDLATKYGKNIKACYLKMQKPYIATLDEAYTLRTDKLSSQGYDGAILKTPAGYIYSIFDNTQIKSATYNIGTFDNTISDIRYDLADGEEKKSKNAGEKPSEEKRGTARKSATVVSEYAGRYAREFGLNTQASEKIAAELEAIEKAFVEGGEGYFQEYRARVENIWKIIRKDGVFELVADDGVYGELSRYMFRRKFRVDKEYRRQMGNEWKSIYKALRGRIAADSNTKYQHIDSFYSSLSESFPGLFPEDIVNVHDQLNRIAEVLAEVKDTHTAAFSFDQLPYNMQSAIGSDIIEMATSYVTRIESNRDVVTRLRSENAELIRALRKERSIREQMAREAAQAARDERAEVFDKKDIELATKIIEGWSRDEIMSLTKGYELKGMTKKKRDNMISQIYIALHEQSAKGQTGPGSVAVKLFAAQIASEYIDSAQIVGEDGKSYHLGDIYDEVSMNRFKQELTDLLFGEFSNMGKHTSNAEFMAKIRRQNEEFRRERLNDSTLIKAAREVSYQAMKLRELAEKQKRDMADDGIQKVTRMLGAVVDPKGNIRIGAVDKAIAEASRFYTMESDKLDSQRSQIPENASITDFAYNSDENMSFIIEELVRLREGREGKALTAEEMKLLGSILRGMKITVERFNKEYVNGHWVEIEKPLGEAIRDVKDFATAEKKYKTSIGRFLGEKIGGAINQAYFYNVLTPETTIETLEGYKKDGLLKTLYHSVRVARQRADHRSVRMKKPFDEFINNKDNAWTDEKGKKRAYREKLNEKTVVVNGNEITLGEGIYLLMLTKREQAHAGLMEGGFITYDENNQRKGRFTIPDIEAARDSIYNQLDEVDKRFLSMAEEFFNVTATKVKEDADMEIFGYTNALEKYYVPIIRDRYSRAVSATDSRQSIGSIITVYNKSFNQNTVENAKALEGKNIMSIICDHADGLADYAELYLPLKAFDRVYNRAVVLDNGETTTLREVLQNDVWNGTEKYLKNLFQDIQGQSRKSDGVIDGLVGKLRSGWVNSVLGLNLKVVATQTTSFVAANQVIEMKYLAPAISKFLGDQSELGERANEYSDIIEARSFDMSALKAQGNIDKVNDLGRKSGFMIEWMDRRVCLAIFHAAELKAEAQGHGAVGTVENARAAAKIADEVIYTTQAMTSQAERSALQRSASEVARTFSMFTADSVKNLSHMYGNVMRYVAHSQRVKNGQVEYQAELAKDRKAVARSATTLVSIGVMLGVITQAFKYLYAKEEEEPEEKAKDFAIDVVSSTFNILPIVSDVADKFVFNYDISLNVFDIVNDTIEDTAGLFGMLGSAMSGKYVSQNEIGKNVINSAKTYATMFGLPLAPLERTVTGLLRRFAPSTVYGYDAMLYNTSYTADLKDAVEKGDEALAEHILTQLYKNEIAGVYTSEELGEVARLYQAGYTSVLPQKIGKTINDVTLTKAQRKQFNSIYSQASAKVNSIMRSAEYKVLTDEQKAKVIKNTYSLYYNRAAAQVVGAEWTRAQAYSQLTDKLDVLFVTQAYKSGLSAYEGDDGKTVSVKTQLLEYLDTLKLDNSTYTVVAYANGVHDGETTAAMLEYINSLALSDEVKARVAAALGFTVQDGKLIKSE